MAYYPKQGSKREEALQILHDKGPLDGPRLAEELGFDTRQFTDCIWPLANHGLVVHERMPNSPTRDSKVFRYSLAPGVLPPHEYVRPPKHEKPGPPAAKPAAQSYRQPRYVSVWHYANGVTC